MAGFRCRRGADRVGHQRRARTHLGPPRGSISPIPDSPSADAVYRELTAGKIWNQRNELRADLVDEVRRRAFTSGRDRGFTDAELGWTSDIFDPDALTIGFARRAATYKRRR